MTKRSRPLQPPPRGALARLQDIPNIGPATVGDFRQLGIHRPSDLPGRDAYQLYHDLCVATGVRHDPCVIDVFLSAVRFMEGAPPLPWWKYTPERKRTLDSADKRPSVARARALVKPVGKRN
jgi:hypothetical protein